MLSPCVYRFTISTRCFGVVLGGLPRVLPGERAECDPLGAAVFGPLENAELLFSAGANAHLQSSFAGVMVCRAFARRRQGERFEILFREVDPVGVHVRAWVTHWVTF
jgi:hypothetical protein